MHFYNYFVKMHCNYTKLVQNLTGLTRGLRGRRQALFLIHFDGLDVLPLTDFLEHLHDGQIF